MRPVFTLRQLEIFLAVARTGHVTRAAEGLHLSQSATSAALAELEERLEGEGARESLFIRAGRGLRLTDRGRRLADEAARLLEDAAELPMRLGEVDGALTGSLRLAASQTIGRDLLAPALAGFAALHPGVTVRCRVTTTSGAIAALLADDAAAAYVEGEREVGGPGLVARPWRRDELAIVTTASQLPADGGRLLPGDLARLPWVLRETGSGTRERFDAALRAAGLPPVVPRLVLDDTEAVRQAIQTGFGWSCLPRRQKRESAGEARHGLVEMPTPFLTLDRCLWRVVRRRTDSGRLLAAFEAYLDGASTE